MKSVTDPQGERSLEQLARRFDYPPTPNIADRRLLTADRRKSHRRATLSGGGRPSAVRGQLAWALLLVVLLVAGLMAVPQTRAAVLSFFGRIGAIDIFIDEAAPTPAPTRPPATGQPLPAGGLPLSATATPRTAPTPRPTLAHSLASLNLGEPVSLDEAVSRARGVPLIPAELGDPDEVYTHRGVDLPAITLVWRMAGGPVSLTQIAIGEYAHKMVTQQSIEETTVDGRPAVWLAGPHALQLLGDWRPNAPVIASNVLIWTDGEMTFRLEGDLTLDEARRIAESLTPAGTE